MAGNSNSGRRGGDDTCPVGALTLRKDYARAGSCRGVAEVYGVQPATAWRWLRTRGVELKSPGGPNNGKGNPKTRK